MTTPPVLPASDGSQPRGLPPTDRPGAGAGTLSVAARDCLARAVADPIDPPPAHDRAAVAAWRALVHAAWLEGDRSAAACGHREERLAGVRCLRAGTEPAPVDPGRSGGSGDPGGSGCPGGSGDPGGSRVAVGSMAAGGTGVVRPLLVYCHGGGYALGSPEVALPITEGLARWVEVVSVDYRLAPEHPFPAAVHDVGAVYQELARAEPGRPLALGGDSAGGNLALTVAAGAAAAGLPVPVGLVLFSPHVDHAPGSDHAPAPRSPLDDVDERAASWLRAAYCGATDAHDPGVSPLRSDLSTLPPTLIQVGTVDSLLGHGIRLARAARLQGVPVTLDVWPGLWHTWHYHRDVPEAAQALEEAGRFLTSLPPGA